MATEYKRTRARKKIKLPSGDEIYVPVITTLNVLDQNGQETEATVDNTVDNVTREIHVDDLHPTSPVDQDGNPSGGATTDPSTSLKVERIDSFIGRDVVTQAQEYKFLIDNMTGSDTAPPRFTTHQKTHIYRYYQNPNNRDDNGVWVDSELIDELSVTDQNGQENIYILNNPTNDQTRGGDLSGQASSDDPDITAAETIDPPYRTDPFQNIVNYSSPWVFATFTFSAGDTGAASGGGPFTPQALGSNLYSALYLQGAVTTRAPSSSSGSIFTAGKTFDYSGASFSPDSASFGNWTVCGFNTPSASPFNAIVIAVKMTASGAPYTQFPSPSNPQAGWITATSADLQILCWNGTGPFDLYTTNPLITNPGMMTNATSAHVGSDQDLANPSHENGSIYVYGDVASTSTQDFSSLILVPHGKTLPQYKPVALRLADFILKDGTAVPGGSGVIALLCKRQ